MELDMDKIEVLHDNVLIEITQPKEDKVGSIYIPLPAQGKDDPAWEGVVHKTGAECEEDLKIGDKVIFNISYSENLNDVCVVCPEEHIVAKIND